MVDTTLHMICIWIHLCAFCVLKVSARGDECFSTFSYVSSKNLGQSMQSHTDCICYIFLQCAFSNVSSNCLPGRMQSHIGYISVKGKGIVTLVAFVWLFSSVRFQMCPQIACSIGCKVTLGAFVWFFSTVRFQMFPQSACRRECKVTLVAFIRLFSTVHF